MKTLKKPSGQTWAKVAYEFRERAEAAEQKLAEARAALGAELSANRALLAELREAKAALARSEAGATEFIGPCAHGRDPYDRCDEEDDPEGGGCGLLTPREALVRRIAYHQRDECMAKLANLSPDIPYIQVVRNTKLVTEKYLYRKHNTAFQKARETP